VTNEGYIIRSASELNYCFAELRKYLDIKLLDTIVISQFIKNEVQNYCVQFYLSKTGDISLLGTTSQLVTEEGNYLGGLIHYNNDMSKFFGMITKVGQYAPSKDTLALLVLMF
jgi:hypothetical protein